MEEDSEDRRCDLRSQSHRCRQGEARSPQITTLSSTHRRRTTASNVSSMSTDIPGSNRTCWTSTDQLHLSDCLNHRPPARLFIILCATNYRCHFFWTANLTSFLLLPLIHLLLHCSHNGRSGDCPRATTDTITITSPDSSDEDQDYTCPHCDRTFTSQIGLVGHLRIHRTETGEPVPEASIYTHRTRLHCPQCPRTFTHRMGLFHYMRIHESGIDRSLDTPIRPSPTPNPPACAPTNQSRTDIDATDLTTPHSSPSSSSSSITATTTATPASVVHDFNTAAPDTTTGTSPATSIIRREGQDYICPHCDRTFTSRIGLVGHLRMRLANQCLEHQPTPTALASTAHTALAPSRIAWVYSATCASTTTCGRQPPVTPRIPSLPTS
nr:unnamed protein product [Spirometra erinaceieuropaei]